MKNFVRPGDLVKGPGVEGLESEGGFSFSLLHFLVMVLFTILLLLANL